MTQAVERMNTAEYDNHKITPPHNPKAKILQLLWRGSKNRVIKNHNKTAEKILAEYDLTSVE